MPANKAGWMTTEFWVTALVIVGNLIAALVDALPPKWASIASMGAAALYAMSRGLAKTTVPYGTGMPTTTATPTNGTADAGTTISVPTGTSISVGTPPPTA